MRMTVLGMAGVHFYDSDRTVIKKVLKLFKESFFDPSLRDLRKECYKDILEAHHEYRDLCRELNI
jgi:hypothetical protein